MMRAEDQGLGAGAMPAPTASLTPRSLAERMTNLHRRWQHLVDATAPYTMERWGATAVLLVLFLLRIVLSHGWYIGT